MNVIPKNFYLLFQLLAYILDLIFFRCNFLICLNILIRVVWSLDLWSNHPYENAQTNENL